MTLAKRSLPTPPVGYELVFDGNVRKGDLAHSDTNEWNPPGKSDFTSIGKKVQSYYAVARPTPKISKAAPSAKGSATEPSSPGAWKTDR